MKIDLRVAHVLAAERVPNSKKLMKLSIDLGSEKGLKVDHRRLDDFAVKNDCYDLDLSKAKNLGDDEKQVLEWLSREFVITAGDIARRLKKLGVSAYAYLRDRLVQAHEIPHLAILLRTAAAGG